MWYQLVFKITNVFYFLPVMDHFGRNETYRHQHFIKYVFWKVPFNATSINFDQKSLLLTCFILWILTIENIFPKCKLNQASVWIAQKVSELGFGLIKWKTKYHNLVHFANDVLTNPDL
jgi:hypothetical protein